MPLCRHPVNANAVIVLDLTADPSLLKTLSVEEISARVFAKSAEIASTDRIGLGSIAINKCPVLVPLNTLRPEDEERLGLDRQQMLQAASLTEQLLDEELIVKIGKVMHREWDNSPYELEGTLYSGAFFSNEDKQRLTKVTKAKPATLANFAGYFDDPRLDTLLWRYRARNHPETLSTAEEHQWRLEAKERLQDDSAPWLGFREYRELLDTIDWPENEQTLATALRDYGNLLETELN